MSAAAAPEVARFLQEHPPFDALDGAEVDRVAAAAEVEFHPAGSTIAAPPESGTSPRICSRRRRSKRAVR